MFQKSIVLSDFVRNEKTPMLEMKFHVRICLSVSFMLYVYLSQHSASNQ